MEPTYLDSAFVNFLLNNTLLTNFLEINVLHQPKDDIISLCTANLEMTRQKQVLRLNKFYETALKVLYDESENELNPINSTQSISFFNLHVLYYINKKMQKIRKTHLKNSMELTERLINLMKNPKFVSDKIDIIVDEEKFFSEMISEPPTYYKLKYFTKKLFDRTVDFSNLAKIKEKIMNLLNDAYLQADKATYYFRENNLQDEFDSILFNKHFPLFKSINNFLNTFTQIQRKMFTPKVSEIFAQFLSILNLNLDPIYSSCCYIFILRSIFSHAYSKSPEYFYPQFDLTKNFTTKTVASQITCSDLAISDEFLPPHQPDDKMIDVFCQNDFYSMGTLHLQFASMLLNPIDAIYEIHEMMLCNRRGAEIIINNKDITVFPFETTFGLYIASVLTSDLPNFDQVAQFIEDFAPQSGMCPEFEYASTTTKAAHEFCRSLVDDFSK